MLVVGADAGSHGGPVHRLGVRHHAVGQVQGLAGQMQRWWRVAGGRGSQRGDPFPLGCGGRAPGVLRQALPPGEAGLVVAHLGQRLGATGVEHEPVEAVVPVVVARHRQHVPVAERPGWGWRGSGMRLGVLRRGFGPGVRRQPEVRQVDRIGPLVDVPGRVDHVTHQQCGVDSLVPEAVRDEAEVADQDVLRRIHLARVAEEEHARGVVQADRHLATHTAVALLGDPAHPAPVHDRSGLPGLDLLGHLVVEAHQQRPGGEPVEVAPARDAPLAKQVPPEGVTRSRRRDHPERAACHRSWAPPSCLSPGQSLRRR